MKVRFCETALWMPGPGQILPLLTGGYGSATAGHDRHKSAKSGLSRNTWEL